MQFFKTYFSDSNGKGSRKSGFFPDIENPQNLINKERISRTVHSQKTLNEVLKPTALFEQFLVVGAKPNLGSKAVEPEVLFKYPPNAPNIPDVATFCFPNGMKYQQIRRTPSMSSLYELMCKQVDLSHSSNMFIFVLTTENREIMWGCCIRKEESLEHPPSFIAQSEREITPKKDSHLLNEFTGKTPNGKASQSLYISQRCYCLITKFPFFQLHFDLLQGILAMEHVYHITNPYLRPARSAPASPVTSSSDLSNVMEQIRERSISEEELPDMVGDVIDVLKKYYAMEVPNAGQTLEFKFPSNTSAQRAILYSRPLLDDEDESTKEWALTLALNVLSKKNLFKAFNACLLEKKVAFVSSNMRILSAVVLAFLPLLKPFVYQSVCIPILPTKMISLLEAPVPFIVGVPQMPPKWPNDVVVLNLDDGVLYSSTSIPDFPRFKGFDNEFYQLYGELKKTWVKDELAYVPTSKQLRFAKRISALFSKSLSSMFNTFREHCITDMSQRNTPITVFIKESFLESFPPEDLNWYATLVETQIFFHYIDMRLRKMDRKAPT